MTRLVLQGIEEERVFDVKPLSVDSTFPIYVTDDRKHVIKVVDADPIDHFRDLFFFFHSRFDQVKKRVKSDSLEKGWSPKVIQYLRYAITSWERAFPFDFGKASLDGDDTVGWGVVGYYLEGIPLNRALQVNISLTTDQVQEIIKRFVCEVAIIHTVGIVHMDITPPNIILNVDERNTFIVDWDLAQISESKLPAVCVVCPYEHSVPLPPGFDPKSTGKAPHTFFDVWYLPVDILDIIATFDQDLRQLFGGGRPSPMFFIKFPTIGKLLDLRAHLENKEAERTWPPDYEITKDYRYFNHSNGKDHLDRFREIISKYVNPELFYRVYLDALDPTKRPGAIDLLNYLTKQPNHSSQ